MFCEDLGMLNQWLPSLKLTARPWKWMVGIRFVSFWDPAYFQGLLLLVSGSVNILESFFESLFNQSIHPFQVWMLLVSGRTRSIYVGVSKNRGTPKSWILIRISIINHPFWCTPIHLGLSALVLVPHHHGSSEVKSRRQEQFRVFLWRACFFWQIMKPVEQSHKKPCYLWKILVGKECLRCFFCWPGVFVLFSLASVMDGLYFCLRSSLLRRSPSKPVRMTLIEFVHWFFKSGCRI